MLSREGCQLEGCQSISQLYALRDRQGKTVSLAGKVTEDLLARCQIDAITQFLGNLQALFTLGKTITKQSFFSTVVKCPRNIMEISSSPWKHLETNPGKLQYHPYAKKNTTRTQQKTTTNGSWRGRNSIMARQRHYPACNVC